MRRLSLIILSLFVLSVLPSFSMFNENTPQQITPVFSMDKSGNSAVVTFDCPELEWQLMEDGTELPILVGAGEEFTAGAPRLPLYSKLIAVPAGKDAVIKSILVDWENDGFHTIVHDPGSMPERALVDPGAFTPAEYNPKVYAEISELTNETAFLGKTGRWRDLRVAQLTVRPLRYDHDTGQVEIARHVDIEIDYLPSEQPDAYDPPGISEALWPVYRDYVLGSDGELDEEEIVRGAFLIICRPMLEDDLDDLIEWRTRCGYHVVLATTEETGTSEEDIHDYLDTFYEAADPPLDYVLLFGDTDNPTDIPCYTIPGHIGYNPWIPTDHKYTYPPEEVDLPEVLPRYFVGRLSVDNATEANIAVNKIVQYEKTPDDGNLDRFEKALVIAKWGEWVPGISQKQTKRWVREKMIANGFDEVEEVYEPGGGTAADISNAVDDGLSWINYRGYGSYDAWAGPYFFSADVNQLNNSDELPVITSMVCGTANFYQTENDPGFGETWIRAGTVNAPEGAVAFIGPGELDTHTRWNNAMDGGWYRGMFDYGYRSLGQLFLAARLEMAYMYPTKWNENPGNGGAYTSVWFYWHNYNILGDPALNIRREIPLDITADYNTTLPGNTTYYPVDITDQDEQPIEGARVVLTNSSLDILGSTLSDENGSAIINMIDPILDNEIDITITRADIMPHYQSLTVTPDEGLTLISFELLEDGVAQDNNDDGVINPGEQVVVSATFEVEEAGGVSDLEANLSLPGGGAEIVEASQVFGDVDFGNQVLVNSLSLVLDSDLENEEQLEFLLSFTGTGYSQEHYFVFSEVSAPVFSIENTTAGGSLGPGDTSELSILIRNSHPSLPSGEVSGSLVSNSQYLTITDPEGSWANVPAGGIANTADDFEVRIAGDCYPGHEANATLVLTTEDGYTSIHSLAIVADGWDDITTPTGPGGPGYYLFEDIDQGYGLDTVYAYESLDDIGDDVGIIDDGNNDDMSVTIDLPFEFTYWDSTYDQVSISSNGWFAFGETEHYFFRNWPIPSALSPHAGIMVFWEDLAHWNGRVYTYHNQEEGWFGIEWHDFTITTSNGEPGRSGPLFFQARLLDPDVHTPRGGQGIIVMMYDEITNNDSDDNLATIGIISPDGQEGIQYEFNDVQDPTAEGVHDGLQITVAVGRVGPPNLILSPPVIQFSAETNQPLATSIIASNTGGEPVEYELWAEGIWPEWELVPGGGAEPDFTSPDDWQGGGELDSIGGPDDYGYIYYDSDERIGPAFNWINIALPQNEVGLVAGESPRVSPGYGLPFDFPFYGETYDMLWISESGYLTFIDPLAGDPSNSRLPDENAPLAGIFPFWDDIGFESDDAMIYVSSFTDSVVVTWQELNHMVWNNDDGPYTFQVLLTSDGAIHFQYHGMNPSFQSSTIGIQDATGEVGLGIKYNLFDEYNLHDDMSIRIAPPAKWFDLSRYSGRINPDQQQTINVTGSSEGFSAGRYFARVVAYSTTLEDFRIIPATLVVYDGNPGGIPRFDEIPGESIWPGEEFTPLYLDPYVFDPDDGDSDLTWTIYGDPFFNMEIGEGNVLQPSIPPDWEGSSSITFRATDQDMNYREIEVEYSTFGENDSPRFDIVSPDFHQAIEPGSEINLSVQASDPEEDEVTYAWHFQEQLISTTSEATVTLDDIGADSIYVVASDGLLENNHTWWFYVGEIDAVNQDINGLPVEYSLNHVYPNPFNSRLTITYSLPQTSDVEINIYNLLGQTVSRYNLADIRPGKHKFNIEGKNWASGLYFVGWEAGGVKQFKKAILLK